MNDSWRDRIEQTETALATKARYRGKGVGKRGGWDKGVPRGNGVSITIPDNRKKLYGAIDAARSKFERMGAHSSTDVSPEVRQAIRNLSDWVFQNVNGYYGDVDEDTLKNFARAVAETKNWLRNEIEREEFRADPERGRGWYPK